MYPLYTIGHSNHSLDKFCALLEKHTIDVLCDVRSAAGSRRNPQYNQGALSNTMGNVGIRYLYLGASLGGRQPDCLDANGRMDYALVARKESFLEGCATLYKLLCSGQRLALMCAEQNPAHCHRSLLICHHFPFRAKIQHILADGAIVSHTEVEKVLFPPSLF